MCLQLSIVEKILAVSIHAVWSSFPSELVRRAKSEKIPLSRTKSQNFYDFSRAYGLDMKFIKGHGASRDAVFRKAKS